MDKNAQLAALERLEKKVRRRLMQGLTTEVIPDVKFIITQYRELRMMEKADLMEMLLNQFISDSLQGGDGSNVEPDAFDASGPVAGPSTKPMSKKKKKESLSFLHKG